MHTKPCLSKTVLKAKGANVTFARVPHIVSFEKLRRLTRGRGLKELFLNPGSSMDTNIKSSSFVCPTRYYGLFLTLLTCKMGEETFSGWK